MYGTQQILVSTSSEHYAVPLSERTKMDKLKEGNVKVTLVAKTPDISDKMKVTKTLHSRFSHPLSEKLVKLVSDASMNSVESF